MVELLAGIPSVVLGFFALMVMATWFQDTFGFESRLNALVSGIALAIAVIPVIFTLAEEALPRFRAATSRPRLALGAARWQTPARRPARGQPGHRRRGRARASAAPSARR